MKHKNQHVVCRAQRVILQSGIRRSGNHAFVNWLGTMLAPSLFCNNNQLWPTDLIEGGGTLPLARREHRQRTDSLPAFGAIIYGMENMHPDIIADRRAVIRKSYHRCLEAKTDEATTILLLRDPFNCFASILNHDTQGDRSYSLYDDGRFACLWLTHARAYAQADELGYVPVDFNRWATCEGYRRDLADRLDIGFSDGGIDHVPAFGHGSSFFRGSTMPAEQRQQLNSRWKWLLEDADRAYELWSNTRNDLFWAAARYLYPELATEVEYELNRLWEQNAHWDSRYVRGFTDNVR